MRGKYSPTVSAAYSKNQDWWKKYAYQDVVTDDFVEFDPEGFDSYGYDVEGYDRSGNDELDYMHNDALDEDWNTNNDYNWKYDSALSHWGFDGVKPVWK